MAEKKVPKRRRSQDERRAFTKAAIMDAALHMLIETGYSGFSASGVAARAGVSRGAQEHYYPKKVDLVAAATDFAMSEAVKHARSSARASAQISTVDPIELFLKSSEEFFFTPPFMAMTEIIIAARADQELSKKVMPIITEARAMLDGLWVETLCEAGYPRESARQFVEMSHYLLRGMFFVQTWLPYDVNRQRIVSNWRQLALNVLQLEVVDPPSKGFSSAATSTS